MSMTLEQVRDGLFACGKGHGFDNNQIDTLHGFARAIDAHLAQPAQSVDVAGLHSRIGKDLENPRFWLDALRISMHTTDCPAKLQALTNAHRELSKFVTAALQEKGNG